MPFLMLGVGAMMYVVVCMVAIAIMSIPLIVVLGLGSALGWIITKLGLLPLFFKPDNVIEAQAEG
jgi:hypothetical protein